MLSLKEKKAIFHSFKLKEKQISHGRVNFVYPESKKKGQVIATQLHHSGNGYVLGKYMSSELIRDKGYKVDARGWISIKDFSEGELIQVITDAMDSMSVSYNKAVGDKKSVAVNITETSNKQEKKEPTIKVIKVSEVPEETKEPHETSIQSKSVPPKNHPIEGKDPYLQYENYSCSYLFAWVGLSLSLMETGFLLWRNALHKYGDIKTQIKK
ncbi:hypothetical protein [Bacillus sp. JJ1764]|uniref:hypothetical protein n=1 Tax=Bacillus sp. JJ1764 TaxID=3122964 RepID=UPI002FFF98DA